MKNYDGHYFTQPIERMPFREIAQGYVKELLLKSWISGLTATDKMVLHEFEKEHEQSYMIYRESNTKEVRGILPFRSRNQGYVVNTIESNLVKSLQGLKKPDDDVIFDAIEYLHERKRSAPGDSDKLKQTYFEDYLIWHLLRLAENFSLRVIRMIVNVLKMNVFTGFTMSGYLPDYVKNFKEIDIHCHIGEDFVDYSDTDLKQSLEQMFLVLSYSRAKNMTRFWVCCNGKAVQVLDEDIPNHPKLVRKAGPPIAKPMIELEMSNKLLDISVQSIDPISLISLFGVKNGQTHELSALSPDLIKSGFDETIWRDQTENPEGIRVSVAPPPGYDAYYIYVFNKYWRGRAAIVVFSRESTDMDYALA